MKNKSIAIITSIHPDYDPRIWKHVKSMSNHGWIVYLICPWVVSENDSILNVSFRIFKRKNNRLFRAIYANFMVAIKIARIFNRVKIMHFHDIDILPIMTLISIVKPVVYDVHENYPDEMLVREWIPKVLRRTLSNLVKWGQYFLCLIIRNIVLVTPHQIQDFNKKYSNIFFNYNFAPRDMAENIGKDMSLRQPLIIFTGGHYIENGTIFILDVIEKLRNEIPDIKLIMFDRFASLSFKKKVIDKIVSNGIENNIRIEKHIKFDELPGYLQQAVVGVSPNLRVPKQEKAIPTKIFEYMATGLPVVTSNLKTQTEIISKSECGILAVPEDINSYVEAIALLVKDRALARKLGENGRIAFLEKYSWESQEDKLMSYYEEILREKTGHQSLPPRH